MKIYDWRKFGTFLAMVLFLILVLLHSCSKKELEVEHYEDYEVECGDTIWSIATSHNPQGANIQELVLEIRKANHIDDCMIYPNEVLKIPVFKEV